MFVGNDSDRLQLIKFWPSRAPRKSGGAKIFGSALLMPACSVCVSSEHFFLLKIEMGKNINPARTNRTRTQVLSRTKAKPNVRNVQEPKPNKTLLRTEQNPNPTVMVLARFCH